MNAAYRRNGTLAIDGTRPEVHNGTTWFISYVGSPLHDHILGFVWQGISFV